MKRLANNFIFNLILLVFVVAVCTMLATTKSYFTVVAGLIAILMFFRVKKIYDKSFSKINFMLNALECNDYLFNFPEFKNSKRERNLNMVLNRIKVLLANAKEQTLEREKYYEHIVNSIDTGIVIINEAGNIFQANSRMHQIVGLEVLTHVNQIARVSQNLANQIILSQPNEPLQATIKNELGDTSLSIVASHLRANNKELKIVAISNLNRALDLKELEAWGRLTRVLTHEIMNSLAPITSLSETLLTMNKDPKLKQGLSTIYQTNKSLISFVDNYRNYTRIQTPTKSPFEIKPLLENIVSLICPKDIETHINVTPLDTMIFADENQILQVVVNLIKNSVQAVEDNTHKHIEVKAYIKEDENIVIEVSNNGPQIQSDVVDNLFIPFFTTKKSGKGIGLSISKQIMQLHNGSLSLTTNQSNKVTFSLIFR